MSSADGRATDEGKEDWPASLWTVTGAAVVQGTAERVAGESEQEARAGLGNHKGTVCEPP